MERDRNQVLVTIFEPLNQARLKVGFNFQIVKSNEPMNSLSSGLFGLGFLYL